MATIRFFCVICGTALQASSDSRDDLLECHSCSRFVPVPRLVSLLGNDAGYPPVLPPEVLELAVKFHCTKCDTRLRADARWEGRRVVCPNCGGTTEVPRWSTAARWPQASAAGGKTPAPVMRPAADAALPTLSLEEIHFLSGPASRNPGAAA